MPVRSNQFQRLIYLIKQSTGDSYDVQESRELVDRVSGRKREVDVVIETEVAGHTILIGIACRDHRNPQSVGWVEEVHGSHPDFGISKSVLVSSSGFTKQAAEKARHYGIDTLTLTEAFHADWAEVVGKHETLWAVRFQASLGSGNLTYAAPYPRERTAECTINTEIFNPDGSKIGSIVYISTYYLQSAQEYEHIVKKMTAGEKWAKLTIGFSSGAYHLDREGNKLLVSHMEVNIDIAYPDERTPISLQHKSLESVLVSYGSTKMDESTIELTVIEQEGKPRSGKLMILPDKPKRSDKRKKKRAENGRALTKTPPTILEFDLRRLANPTTPAPAPPEPSD